MQQIFALVDCNNFYASCERIFNPKLEGKPIVVLSNNDGCIIARSNEAKSLGIKMGVPAFEIRDIIEKNNVHVFSTNFALYGDISQRVMNILSGFTPEIEIYSIDEAFLNLTGIIDMNITDLAVNMRNKIKQWTGVPVSIGIATTKTLAKIANHIAKKNTHPFCRNERYKYIFDFTALSDIDKELKQIPVEDIWGIGRQYTKFLLKNNIKTAFDLKNTDESWIRKYMGVIGQRIILELRGISCYPIDINPAEKKEICTSRSYGKPLQKYEDIEQATTTYVSRVAEKLRKQHTLAQTLLVFIMTNKFAKGPQYVNYKIVQLPVATNNTSELIHYAVIALKALYKKGYKYKKSGVIVSNIIPDNIRQAVLWDNVNREKFKELIKIVDKINASMGRDKIKYAIQGTKKRWKMRQENLSPCYSTKWNDLLSVDIDKSFNSDTDELVDKSRQ